MKTIITLFTAVLLSQALSAQVILPPSVDTNIRPIILIPQTEIFVPNVFSVNSGNPDNQKLYVFGIGIATLDFKIFDRLGELVYESADNNRSIRYDGQCCRYGDGWDGSFLGEPLTTASFAYVLKGYFVTGKPFSEAGNITLIDNKF